MRYCCSIMKEKIGKGRFIAAGVRKDESTLFPEARKVDVLDTLYCDPVHDRGLMCVERQVFTKKDVVWDMIFLIISGLTLMLIGY